ncbi:MAG: ATP-binding protein [Candidatus Latescibacterota bacterium]
MSAGLRVFVSSVQKELEDERVIVQNLLSTDAFLSAHCLPVLYEYEPASADRAAEGCLKALDTCQVYLIIVGSQYGTRVAAGGPSITHTEYRHAREAGLPVLAFIKGDAGLQREEGTAALLVELDHDGYKYKRFGNVIELQKEVRAALVRLLHDRFGIGPTTDEDQVAQQTIEATSPFEAQTLTRMHWAELDHAVARRVVAAAEGRAPEAIPEEELLAGLTLRGLVWRSPDSGQSYATAAGIVLLAPDPSAVFPQCRMLADAYRGAEADGAPRDHEDIRAPMPVAIDRAMAFVDRNTRHPMRVVGLNRVRLDEYPVEALREGLVNAVAHRQYEDAGRKILLEVFADRVVVASPGLPPAPVTLARLRSGRYRPCSRNPVLAQCLAGFHRIEERGSGFRRMREQMLDHGLDAPLLATNTGYFEVTFCGPADDLERLRVPEARLRVTPAVEAQLSERQRRMAALLAEGEELTSRRCQELFGVTRDTAARDFGLLTELGLAVRKGRGRSTRYVLAGGP